MDEDESVVRALGLGREEPPLAEQLDDLASWWRVADDDARTRMSKLLGDAGRPDDDRPTR